MILVISLRQQINVLKNRQLLNFCTKKQLRAQRRAAKRQGGPILLIKNNVFFFFGVISLTISTVKKTIKENPVTYLQIALADKKSFWYFPA